jgi:hypothetical protein
MKALLPPLPALYGRTEQERAARRFSLEHAALLLMGSTIIVWTLSIGLGYEFGVTIMTLLAFAITILGLFHPRLGLLGLGMMVALDPMTRVFMATGGLWRWNTFNYWLLLTMALSIPLLLRLRDIHTRLLQLFIVLLGVGLLISPSLSSGIQHTLGIVAIFGLLVYFARAGHDSDVWFWMGMVNGVLASVGSLAYYVQKDSVQYIDHNLWAYFPLTAIYSIALAMPFTRQSPRRQFGLVMLAFVNYGWIFLSGSRSNLLLGTICIIFLVIAMRGVFNRTIIIGMAVLLALMVPIFFSDLTDNTVERIEKLFNENASAADRTNGRATLMLGGWYIFQDNPLGVGTGGFKTAWSRLDMREGLGFRFGQAFSSHSGWIRTLVENGFQGFMLLFAFVWSFAYMGLRQRDRILMMLGVLTSLCMSITFFATEFQNKGLWFLAAGMIMIYHREQIVELVRSAEQRLPGFNVVRPTAPPEAR